MTQKPEQRPWGFTWIALAIIGFVLAYTYIRLQYAREEAPSNPYEESQQVLSGPLEGSAPWTQIPVNVLQDNPASTPLQLNYLPMAAGIPREFGVIIPPGAVWPSVVEAVSLSRGEGRIRLELTVAWPEDSRPPSGWFGFSRAQLTPEQAGGSARLLAQIRSELERSLFLTDHLLLLPDPSSQALGPQETSRRITLDFPETALPSPKARIVLPTRRGLAFVEPGTVDPAP